MAEVSLPARAAKNYPRGHEPITIDKNASRAQNLAVPGQSVDESNYTKPRCWSLHAPSVISLWASTLLHVSSLIGHLMQVHIRFLIRWRRERERGGREQGGCFARKPPHRLKFRTMRPLPHHCTSCYCHATHNILLFNTQIMELVFIMRHLIRQPTVCIDFFIVSR